MSEEKYQLAQMMSPTSRTGIIMVGIMLGMLAGTLARDLAGIIWIFLLILSAGIVGIAQQTLP